MSKPNEHTNEIDYYIATFDENERGELAAADAALDLAVLLYRARKQRGLSQQDAATRAGLQQQAVSRFEQAHANVQIATLQRYLGALGYVLDIAIKDAETGEVLGHTSLLPV